MDWWMDRWIISQCRKSDSRTTSPIFLRRTLVADESYVNRLEFGEPYSVGALQHQQYVFIRLAWDV